MHERTCEESYRKRTSIHWDVDESVALGASISAGVRMIKEDPSSTSDSAKKELQSISINDVTPRHFGTKSLDGNLNATLVNSIIFGKKYSDSMF